MAAIETSNSKSALSLAHHVEDQKSVARNLVDFVVACASFSIFGAQFVFMSFNQCWWSFGEALFFDLQNPQVRAFLLWGGMSIMGGVMTVVLLLLLWHTLSFKSPAMHSFWKWSPWFAPALMPGGFFSRPAAITVVILLFTTTSLTVATVTAGDALAGAGICESMGGDSDNCYPSFAFPDHPYAFEALPLNSSLGLVHPCTQSSNGVCLEEDPSQTCSYQCVKYDPWGVDLFLPKVGAILGGSAFAVKIADSLSLAVGWGLVTEDTSPEEIRRIATHHGKQLFPRRSCGACALQLLALAALMQQAAIRVDSNGPHTAASTVALVVLLSISTAVFQRFWSPAHCGRLYYTRKLWQEGRDFFAQENEEGELELRQLDLFEWIHLTNEQRLAHLVNFARRVDQGPESVRTRVTSLAQGEHVHEEDCEMVLPNGDRKMVSAKTKVHVDVGGMGTVIQEQGDKILVHWDLSQKETLVEPFHLSEHSEEWDACLRDIGLLKTEVGLEEGLLR